MIDHKVAEGQDMGQIIADAYKGINLGQVDKDNGNNGDQPMKFDPNQLNIDHKAMEAFKEMMEGMKGNIDQSEF